jgi:hypothetical protein
MTAHSTPPTHTPSPWPWLWIAAVALLAATGAQAVVHNVDFSPACKSAAPNCSLEPACCDTNPGACTPAELEQCCVNIETTVGGMVNDSVQGINTAGAVSWLFDIEPSGCSGAAPTFTCGGITIDASGDPVTIAGTSSGAGSFFFAVEGDDGVETCYEGFELLISDPFDLVFVLDRSGSMGGSTHILAPASSRWDALERAVNGFVDPHVVTSSCAESSGVGMTFFSTNVLPNVSFNAGLESATTPMLEDLIRQEMIDQRPPGGATGMGAGLQDGIGKLTTPDKKRVVMLFSDGQQNRDPRVNHLTGTDYTSGGAPAGTIAPGGSGDFRIVTVGIGNPAGDYQDALQNLATAHGGAYHVTATGEDISASLDTATADLLDGCSPQMVASYSGQLQGQVDLTPFDINRRVGRLSIKFSYSDDFEVPTLAKLIGGVRIEKDGTDVTGFFQPRIVGNFTNSFTLSTDFVLPDTSGSAGVLAPEGTYAVRMVQTMDRVLDYRAVVFADDQRLDMATAISPGAPKAGGSFEPSVDLSWFGGPLTGATAEALILQPGDDLGDLLANNPLQVDPVSGEDAGSPGEQKFLALLEDADFLAQMLPSEQQVALTDPDGDGTYSGSFSPGDISGVYQVIYRVSADDPASFGRLQRQARRSVWVRPNEIDRQASAMSASVSGNTIVWQIKPVTIDGRLWGPAQAGALSVDGAGVQVTDIVDDQFGGYTITLTGDPGSDVTVSILDEEIYSGDAGGFGPVSGGEDGGKLPGSLLWLIILIILVILVWILRKVFK